MTSFRFVGAILATGLMVQDGSTQLLQLVTERIKAGSEAAYFSVEVETAAACAALRCPHPHLALQPLDGPLELWWINMFASEADRLRVTEEYSRNAPLMEVLERNSKRKSAFTSAPTDALLRYSTELSRGALLDFAAARFVVATRQSGDGAQTTEGAVFEAPDGSRLVLQLARTRRDAEGLQSRGGSGAMILAIRPEFGMPAAAWVDADPEFWARNPAARR